MQTKYASGLVWFRRDLRIHDNTALNIALQQCERVYCAFLFDTEILEALPRQDRRVEFIRESLVELDGNLSALSNQTHAGLIVLHGRAEEEIPTLVRELGVQAVFAGRDYEPKAIARDHAVAHRLTLSGSSLHLLKDHVIFEEREVLTQMGKPYGVFTPYLRAWLARLLDQPAIETQPPSPYRLAPRPEGYRADVPSLGSIGFESTNLRALKIPTGESGAQALLADFATRMGRYEETRNFPAIKGPSYLSVHLRFGTVSIRQLVNLAQPRHIQGDQGATTWLAELVWRDFYAQILANFPHVVTGSYKPEYDAIAWEEGPLAEKLFDAWRNGATGYPVVDAAMVQLNQTGYMHNRLRMVAGSFLVKHLGIDWRWGERVFACLLNDFDLSSNNGGWQWVSSSGCDAQPYFRIFNPVSQSERFDAQGRFIRRYLPQLAKLGPKTIHAPWLAKPLELAAAGFTPGVDYPLPIVDHAQARSRTLLRYGVVKKQT
ncbi:MAG: deoxyribodipyrimidine photo-lyase [Curvibacter sp.]|nr:MAG: deoxyribodipyrimidine photo-lyase [Curvibacter sp.]